MLQMDKLLNELIQFITTQLRGELLNQGHNFTGTLAKTIEASIEKKVNSTNIKFLIQDYGLSLNDGIKPSRIPYTRGSGKRTSKYIEGLRRWVRGKLGFSQKRAERVAFAIASKQKEKGYPLTGKIGWIDITLESNKKLIADKVEEYVQVLIEDLIDQIIRESNGR